MRSGTSSRQHRARVELVPVSARDSQLASPGQGSPQRALGQGVCCSELVDIGALAVARWGETQVEQRMGMGMLEQQGLHLRPRALS